jgi:hypothetical protein
MLGHASVETTQSTYVAAVTLDELAAAVEGLSFGTPLGRDPANPRKAPTGIEPVYTALQAAA